MSVIASPEEDTGENVAETSDADRIVGEVRTKPRTGARIEDAVERTVNDLIAEGKLARDDRG
jgi:hypothetical protein